MESQGKAFSTVSIPYFAVSISINYIQKKKKKLRWAKLTKCRYEFG